MRYLVLLSATLILCAGLAWGEDTSASSAPNTPLVSATFVYVLGMDMYTPSSMAMPAKGDTFTDPNFHTQCRRISAPADGYRAAGIQNEYAKSDPLNCDGTRLILRGNDGTFYLYNAHTCAVIESLTFFRDCGWEDCEPRWDDSNPSLFYYNCEMQLKSYNITTHAITTIRDFSADFPAGAVIGTEVEGDASLDRRYWAFLVQDADYNRIAVFVYDLINDSIVGQKPTSELPEDINWVSMSMSGQYCIVGYGWFPLYIEVFSRDFTSFDICLPEGSNAHGDFAIGWDGREKYVYQNNRTDYLSMADLETAVETQLLFFPFGINADIGVHVSGNCSSTPGWVLVSTYGSFNAPPGDAHSWMDCQLYMVQLCSSPIIWRIAHTQCYEGLNPGDPGSYLWEAFATITKDGSKIYWGSNWRDYTEDYCDAYEVILPANWEDELVGIEDGYSCALPHDLEITACPNPFNSSCEISLVGAYCIRPYDMRIEIFDLNGRCVFLNEELIVKSEELQPPASQAGGGIGTLFTLNSSLFTSVWTPDKSFSSGVYLVRATMGDDFSTIKRIVFLK